jgi:hypothetical protein
MQEKSISRLLTEALAIEAEEAKAENCTWQRNHQNSEIRGIYGSNYQETNWKR